MGKSRMAKKRERKEKAKEPEHKEENENDDRHKLEHDESNVHGGNPHTERNAGVADTAHKLGASAGHGHGHGPGHERHVSGAWPPTPFITLAGENRGASLNVIHAAAEAERKDKERQPARGRLDHGGKEQQGGWGLTAFVSSNVQVVNNSLVMQSSCGSSDPGVHLKLATASRKKGDGEEAGGKGGGAAAVKRN